jgi:hypothetical protein
VVSKLFQLFCQHPLNMNATANAIAEDPSLQPAVIEATNIRQIQEGLGSYARLSGAVEVALLDPTGAVLVRWDGSDRQADLDALGVLATASFTATKSMVQRLGDKSFGGICHQGREHCLYIAPLMRGYMLLTMHSANARVPDMRQSLVRIVTRLNQQLVQESAPK